MLINLLSKAVKYNVKGGRIFVKCRRHDGRIRVTIQDTGRGIAAEFMPRLFTPFDRLGAETSAIAGIGLGLALSQQLSERMGGVIGVSSEAGIGSTFWVDVPEAAQNSWPVASTDTIDRNGGATW